jgi:uncharacterized peroxidase-related enzyme
MTFIETVPEELATGTLADLYAHDVAAQGYVATYTRVFSLRPEVYAAWREMAGVIRRRMDLRRYELATLAAARGLRSAYCTMAHCRVLRDRFYDTETVRRIATDHVHAGLSDTDVAIMDFADHVARDASSIDRTEIEQLRDHGLSDADILDVVLTAAARCFFSSVLHSTGARADSALSESLEPPLRSALTGQASAPHSPAVVRTSG